MVLTVAAIPCEAFSQSKEVAEALDFYSGQIRANQEKLSTYKANVSHEILLHRSKVKTANQDKGVTKFTEVAGPFLLRMKVDYRIAASIQSGDVWQETISTSGPDYLDPETEEIVSLRNELQSVTHRDFLENSEQLVTKDQIRNLNGDVVYSVFKRLPFSTSAPSRPIKLDELFEVQSSGTIADFLTQTSGFVTSGDYTGSVSKSPTVHVVELKLVETGRDIFRFAFDPNMGYMLTEFEFLGVPDAPDLNKRITFQYEEVGGVFFPSSKVLSVANDSILQRKTSFVLSDIVVNEELSDEQFSLNALQPKDGDKLIDEIDNVVLEFKNGVFRER